MADNKNQLGAEPPPCFNCQGITRFYRRIVDADKGVAYELFDCDVCSQTTTRKAPT